MPDGKVFPDKGNLILGWSRDGLSYEQIAQNMGISLNSLKLWRKKYPALDAILRQGKEVSDYAVENALYKKAINGDVTAQIFWLKNRRPERWRDRPQASANSNQTMLMEALLNCCSNKPTKPLEFKTGDDI